SWWWKTRPSKLIKLGSWNESQLTHNSSDNLVKSSAISPDGKFVAFVDDSGLHITIADTGETHDVSLPAEIARRLQAVSWFPDGQRLVLETQSEDEGSVLWLSSIFGGPPQKLRAHSSQARVAPDSSIAFISNDGHEIWVSDPNGENPRKILSSHDGDFCLVSWSPLSSRLAYGASKSRMLGGSIGTVSLDGKSQNTIFSSDWMRCDKPSPLVWLEDGRILFAQDSPPPLYSVNLCSLQSDPKTGVSSGKPRKVTNWFGFVPWYFSASRDGSRFAMIKARDWWDIYLASLPVVAGQSSPPKRLSTAENFDFPSAWSSDSKAILFDSNRNQRNQIFRQALDQDAPELLLPGSSDLDLRFGIFAPDGASILYWAFKHNDPAGQDVSLMKVPVSGGAPQKLLSAGSEVVSFNCPAHSPASCVAVRAESGYLVFYALDLNHGLGKELARTKLANADDLAADVSPNSQRLAIISSSLLPGKIRFLDLVNRSETDRAISLPPGATVRNIAWAVDNRSLFAVISQAGRYKLIE